MSDIDIDDLVAFMLEDLDHEAVDALAPRIIKTLAGNRQGVILATLAMIVVVVCRKAGDHRDELSQAFCRLVTLSQGNNENE